MLERRVERLEKLMDNRGKPCQCCANIIQVTNEKLCYYCWSTKCKNCPKKKKKIKKEGQK